jgi:hypothetical protein
MPFDPGTSSSGLKRLKTLLFSHLARETAKHGAAAAMAVTQAEKPGGVAVISAPGEIRESKEICRELLRLAGLRGALPAPDAGSASPETSGDNASVAPGVGGAASGTGVGGVSPEKSGHSVLPVPSVNSFSPEIGRDVGQAAKDGLRLNEIGIFLREPAKYVSHLARVFDATGVEPFIADGLPLGRSRAARSLILLMDLIESGFARREVMDFLTFADIDLGSFFESGSGSKHMRRGSSPAKDTPVPKVEGVNPALWDILSKEAGVVKGLDTWGKKLSALRNRRRPSPDTGESYAEEGVRVDRTREQALGTLIRFMAKMSAWMKLFPMEGAAAKLAEETIALYGALIAPGPERDRVIQAIGDLALLDSCAHVLDRSFFFWLGRKHLEQVQSSLGYFQGEGPAVAGLMSARGLPFKVVVLPGLAEGCFPKAARQDPVLLDGERIALNGAFGAVGIEGELGLKSDRLREEKLLFRLSVGAASKHVLFTFPRLDPFTGAERLPSSYLLEAVRAVTGSHFDAGSVDALPFLTRVPLATLFPDDGAFLEQSEFDLSLAEAAVGQNDQDALAHLRRGEKFFKNAMEAEGKRWGTRVFTRFDGAMETPEAISLLRGRYVGRSGVAGPTSLESYAACPFVYLMRHILGIKAVEDPEELLSMPPMDKGGLAHEILESAYRIIFSGGDKIRPDWEVVLRARASEVLKSYRSKSDFGLPLLWELEEEQLIDDLVSSVRQDLEELDGFAPWELELAYGLKRGDGSKDPLQFSLSEERRIPLGGVMDRVDRDRDARKAKVVDYKTGVGAGYKDDSLRGGRTLQLPLYVLGARHLFGVELDVEVAEYFFVSGRRRGSRVRFAAQTVDRRMNDLKTILGTIVRGVEAGLFFACPGDYCKYCDYAMACGSCWKLFERKQTDPRAEAFLKMLEID